MKKIIAFLLTLLLLLPMVACSKDAGSDLDPVLAARRDSAESYMRNMCTVIWSPEEDILYTTQNKVLPEEAKENTKMQLHADRIYRGMPYAYAGSTLISSGEHLWVCHSERLTCPEPKANTAFIRTRRYSDL